MLAPSLHTAPSSPPKALLQLVRLRSPFYVVVPAHEYTEIVRDDVDAIFEQLDGKKEGCEVRWHVTIRSLDDFPAVVALHRGPPSPSQESVGGVRARPVDVAGE